MNQAHPAKDTARKLYGPTVQYADGREILGQPVDVEHILSQFEHLDADARGAFLCAVAHDLTVAIRSIVFDQPVSQAGLDRVKWINESLHRLTGCVNPQRRWSAHDEARLIRGIIENAFEHGFDVWIGRAIAVAAENTVVPKKSMKS